MRTDQFDILPLGLKPHLKHIIYGSPLQDVWLLCRKTLKAHSCWKSGIHSLLCVSNCGCSRTNRGGWDVSLGVGGRDNFGWVLRFSGQHEWCKDFGGVCNMHSGGGAGSYSSDGWLWSAVLPWRSSRRGNHVVCVEGGGCCRRCGGDGGGSERGLWDEGVVTLWESLQFDWHVRTDIWFAPGLWMG